ncbi:MAG: calcium/sodium antiporter [Candidatus Dadabacteria bacterium]|nr:calcium/sodium antiporter [Candidatus Dadabacteria bacterium]MYA48361.1 calcium/sodium antiporter [Candidatus Dadabacteria bacterium]MYF47668.1 calcium/sodium antiporter [Candidatus Dadabacteria bacterium]MYG83601.1 calcium/sodium antiporter [Candidatus Dadabacteria bacterium]MYK49240.1 calcium/sodium antiporter [Candidatus Dadabacteria bacterium]
MEISNLLIFVASLFVLWKGADFLVKGASGIAKLTGMGPFFAGFIVVALGTSLPEFMVCLVAAVMDSSDIAVGNMVGSNIANIGLIFGLTALISPVVIAKEAWEEQKLPLIFLVIMTLAAYGLSRAGFSIGRGEGALLFLLLIVFLLVPYEKSRVEKNEALSAVQGEGGWKLLFYVVLGSVLLAGSAHFLVKSAIGMATELGISELFIGVTAVALGTSLPELGTSLAAAWKKEQNIVVGNIIGSNFFNLGFLGLVAVIRPVDVNRDMFGNTSEFGFLILLTVIFTLLIGKTWLGRNRIGKKKGAILLIVYAAFLYFISGSLS